ncbi:MAG: glycosyltransferase [Magnetospirillum sp.]|nr:glycosyltransferase [Magnetospirillum sp.]
MRIFLGNPGLLSFNGHPFPYLDCLRTALRKARHEVHVLGGRRMLPELAAREGVLPALSVPSAGQVMGAYGDEIAERKRYYTMVIQTLRGAPENEGLRTMRRFCLRHYDWFAAWVVDTMLQDLDEIDSSFSLSASDLVVFDDIRREHIAAIAEWVAYRLRAGDQNRTPRFAVVLHTGAEHENVVCAAEPGYGDVLARIRESGFADRIVLFADTDALAAEFSVLGGMEVTTLPIPHTRHPDTAQARRNDGVPTLMFAGQGHCAHGFHLLPHIVDRFSALAAAGRLRFEIQSHIVAPDELLSMARLALGRMPATLHEGRLNAQDYYALMARADISLFPYLGVRFRIQSSGVFAEAVAFGTVPVVPAGTWMAGIVERHGMGAVFDPSSSDDLCAAIGRTLSGLDALKQRAAAFAVEWHRINSPENYLDVMGRRIGGDSLGNPAFAFGPQ